MATARADVTAQSPRVNNQCNAALVHGTQHLIPIRVELPAVVVRVGIEILRHSA